MRFHTKPCLFLHLKQLQFTCAMGSQLAAAEKHTLECKAITNKLAFFFSYSHGKLQLSISYLAS